MTKVIILSELVANIRCRRNGKTFLAEFVNRCEAQNAVIIPPNATNEDVIKAMFPSIESRLDEKTGITVTKWADGTGKCFRTDWWNAPYKGSEG